MSAPARMRALEVSALAEDFSGCALAERPVPKPADGEVLVRVRAAALGFPALLMTKGAYQHRPALPFVLGGDFAGEVVACGKGTEALMSARVGASAITGAFAEYCVAPATQLISPPNSASFAQATAFPSAYLTAHVGLAQLGRLRRGEWVLVLGAGGGVGLAAVDLALAMGANVIAAASTQAKREAIALLHPRAHVIDSAGPIKETVRSLSGGGVHVAYDPVGGAGFATALSSLAFGGRLLVVGFASGAIPTLSVNRALIKNAAILGVRAGEYSRRFPEARAQAMSELTALWNAGTLRPHVDVVLPLEEWRAGMARIISRECVGRAVLTP